MCHMSFVPSRIQIGHIGQRHKLCFPAFRLLLYPIFAWCSWRGAPPAVVFVATATLGATNGSLTTTAFLYASKLAGPVEADICGLLMVLCLMFGLLAGSIFSWLWLL
jgi:hypothetical protein